MYIVKNITDGTETTCDAIEFIRTDGNEYAPAEQAQADGFRALVIVDVDEHTQRYDETRYAFEGHTLHGKEPIGAFAAQPEPELALEPEPEPEPESTTTVNLLEDALCELDAANEERLAAIEDALCELDKV